jgi:hypothetical protein
MDNRLASSSSDNRQKRRKIDIARHSFSECLCSSPLSSVRLLPFPVCNSELP